MRTVTPKIKEIKQGNDFSNLVELLQYRAEYQKDKVAYIFLVDGENQEVKITYGELDHQARAIAATLQKEFAPGERALLLYPSGLEFISGFFGCLYAGIIAVPVYPPNPNQINAGMKKLNKIISNAEPEVVLTTNEVLPELKLLSGKYAKLRKMKWIASDNVKEYSAKKWQSPNIKSNELAFLQYTSGPTGVPKGVMVSHRNILYNEEMYKVAVQHTDKAVVVGWIPLYHDMGLIGNTLYPIYLGVPCIFMPSIAFLRKPFRWLKAISHYKATISSAPNFAYDLCASKVTTDQLAKLDFTSWEIALNGAEFVKAETLRRFTDTFKVCGFRKESFQACFGMAEATLFVSGGLKNESPIIVHVDKTAFTQNKVIICDQEQENTRAIVSCGKTWLEQKILIVDSETLTKCPPDKIGEIWVNGSSVTKGYWNNPEQTEKTFNAYIADTGEGPFLRTGDLGFIKDSELFVTGRIKDMIIIRGRNHYSQDVECTVEQCHKVLRPGCGAAFSVDVECEERLVVVQEVIFDHVNELNKKDVIEAIRRAISKQHELQVYSIVLIKDKTIPKTSSGKIQRKLCKKMFLEKSLIILKQWQHTKTIKDVKKTISKNDLQENVQEVLSKTISDILNLDESEIDIAVDLSNYGVDSAQIAEFAYKIEERYGIEFESLSIFSEYPTIKSFSKNFCEKYKVVLHR